MVIIEREDACRAGVLVCIKVFQIVIHRWSRLRSIVFLNLFNDLLSFLLGSWQVQAPMTVPHWPTVALQFPTAERLETDLSQTILIRYPDLNILLTLTLLVGCPFRVYLWMSYKIAVTKGNTRTLRVPTLSMQSKGKMANVSQWEGHVRPSQVGAATHHMGQLKISNAKQRGVKWVLPNV